MNGQSETPNVAIIGRPNVGKSALFNRLIGRKIAIVHDQPGITRDRLSAICARAEQPFNLWDTGGVFGAGETELTTQVGQAAEEASRESDLLLFVVDAKEGLSPIDQELARTLRKSHKPIVLVVNKIDNEKHENLAAEFASLGFERSFSISAEHGRGISELLDAITELLPAPVDIQHPARHRTSPSEWRTSSIQHPLALAVIGRPNVGKSSLINSILRSERAIVSQLPGTTRDAIDISYERNGEQFLFIDTAGIRRRGKHSSSVEVFSVMRAERSIRRANLCVLIVDVTSGVTAQDKRIAGLIQEARKAAIVVLNKWDLIKPKRGERQTIKQLVDAARERLFFLDYAPVLIASARTGENIDKLFGFIAKIQRESRARIGTGVFNRLLRAAFAANPPPMKKGRRLKLFYAAQAAGKKDRPLQPPEFVLFVNDPRLLADQYKRYLESRIRDAQAYTGLPIIFTCRARTESRRA
ncbi:MAG TPA: ribosome biogenesis GTPase Der [Spartobacteria bacterium]|jgi:GTP-binding protein|nr:ribosome biogenesis GTPase Der [Spartobacteria bacterium]